MKSLTRIVAALAVCVALFGVSSLMADSVPAPPPEPLCGCLCPDGSIIITHAPDENSCEPVCAAACAASGGQES